LADTANISVKINETVPDWAYNTKIYPTVLGDWPMINWQPHQPQTIIKTHYEHFLPNIKNVSAVARPSAPILGMEDGIQY